MSLKLKHKGKTTISYSENTWWITGFNPKLQNVKSSNLTATFTINFSSNKGMFNSLYTQNKSRAGLSFNTNKHTVTYTFNKGEMRT
ncbi:MAG: DUF4474 domain-containing protein [Clostridiales bacterium]|nr:DUF4474 domain-containing protein [Clostridiales bacterium]